MSSGVVSASHTRSTGAATVIEAFVSMSTRRRRTRTGRLMNPAETAQRELAGGTSLQAIEDRSSKERP
jgi:hypothetical protein